MKTNISERDVYLQQYLQKRRQEETIKAIRTVMKTKAGRWLFICILEMTGYQGEAFTGNSQTFYNEGRRSIGIELNKKIVNLLGKEGFELKQKAEKEFIDFQYKEKHVLQEREEENGRE